MFALERLQIPILPLLHTHAHGCMCVLGTTHRKICAATDTKWTSVLHASSLGHFSSHLLHCANATEVWVSHTKQHIHVHSAPQPPFTN